MCRKILFLFSMFFVILPFTSCSSDATVKLYMVKDTEYFVYKMDYVEINKENNSCITNEDLKLLYEKNHGEIENDFIIKDYKLFSDESLTTELGNDYQVKNGDVIYIYLNANDYSVKPGGYVPRSFIYYTGSTIPEELSDNMFWPVNSLYMEGYYIPLKENKVSKVELFEFFKNYRKFVGYTLEENINNVKFENIDDFIISVNDEAIDDFYEFNYDDSFEVTITHKSLIK